MSMLRYAWYDSTLAYLLRTWGYGRVSSNAAPKQKGRA
jgi:hypothetical protein